MNLQDLIYEVLLHDRLIASFLDKDDAINFAKTKKESYSWIEVWDRRNVIRIYEWTY